jgi:hypothetical protein
MKDDADKTSCHSSRRRGSEHQPSEGFTATRFRKVQILGPPINENRANRAYGPQITERDAYYCMLEVENVSGKGKTVRLRDSGAALRRGPHEASEGRPGEEDNTILAAARDWWKAALATHLVSDAEELA